MATSHHCFSSTSLLISFSSSPKPKLRTTPNHLKVKLKPCSAVGGGDMLGEFGARDPFPAEIETSFADKVANYGTEHRILIPNLSSLSLAQQDCTVVSPVQPPMSSQDAQQLIRKVIGWRIVDVGGTLRLQCLWKLSNYKCGVELINRIFSVVEKAGHYPILHLEPPNHVRAEIWTSSIGGLSVNDFILAAKIDEIKTSDLVPKRRAWA